MKNIFITTIFKRKCNQAFTLIELLVVIAIISLLSAVVLNSLASARMKANDAKISEDLRQFRIAAELYYNDNHVYPPTAINYKNSVLAVQDKQDGWANKLSFFMKRAEAAGGHSITALCVNFDKVASSLVSSKYLATIPVHPYDNDSKGVCYKAVNSGGSFSSYAPLTTLINVGSGATAGVISKRTGFIMGDTSPVGISSLAATTNTLAPAETPYPMGVDATTSLDVSKSADVIYGIIGGIPGSVGAGSIITSTSSTAPVTYTLNVTVLNSPGGTVSYNPNKSSYSPGDVVNFTAYPTYGYSLTYWIGCTITGPSTCTVTMDSNKTVYASFNYGYNFSVVNSTPSNGSISYTPMKSQYLSGDVITVTATPKPGYSVSFWGGCTSSSGNTCTVNMGPYDKTLYLSFDLTPL